MINTKSVSSNRATAQASTSAPLSHPKLRLHQDGRVSFRDTSGQWTRYVTRSRPKWFPRRLSASASGWAIRRSSMAAARSFLYSLSTSRSTRAVSSLQCRDSPHCGQGGMRGCRHLSAVQSMPLASPSRSYTQRGLTQLESAFAAAGLNGHRKQITQSISCDDHVWPLWAPIWLRKPSRSARLLGWNASAAEMAGQVACHSLSRSMRGEPTLALPCGSNIVTAALMKASFTAPGLG